MSLKFNNTEITSTIFKDAAHPDGVTLCKLVYNGTLVWEKHAYGSWTTTTEASCTTVGAKERTCTRTGCGDFEREQIPATGHNWNSPTYYWDGRVSVEATRRCKNDTSHVETAVSYNPTSSITTPATCTTAGVRTYTATFSESWANTPGVEQTETITALGHSWSTGVVTTEATCEEAGVKTYTCTRTDCGKTKTENIPATGHNWATKVAYVWAPDYSTCVATRNCLNDLTHADTFNGGVSSAVTKYPTCSKDGTRTYTAKFSGQIGDWTADLKAQTITETIPATGVHTAGDDWVTTVQPTTISTGLRVKKCTGCEKVMEEETLPQLNPFTYTLLSDNTYSIKATDTNISGEITIPSTYNGKAVSRIADNGFAGCTSIIYVELPDSITTIGTSAFLGCDALSEINIPDSVTYIEPEAFRGCASLEGITQNYEYWSTFTSDSGRDYLSVTGQEMALYLTNDYMYHEWYKFYAPVISAELNTSATGVIVNIQNKNSIKLKLSVNAAFSGATVGSDTYTETMSGNSSANASLAIGEEFSKCTIDACFTEFAQCKTTLTVAGTGEETEGTGDTVETGTYHYFGNYPPEVYAIELFDSDSLSGYYSDELIAGGYLENDVGVVVPVLYKTNVEQFPGEVDMEDAFFYIGRATVDGTVCDKWRKIELGGDSDFAWTSPYQGFIYTDIIVGGGRFMDGILEE